MKRIICLVSIALLLIGALPIYAQKCYLGVIGGMNIADMYLIGETVEQDVSTRNVFGVGGIMGIQFDNTFSIEVNPMYLQKGGTLLQDDSDPDVDIATAFIELPLYIKVAFGKTIRPFVLAGPTVGYLLSSKAEIVVGGYLLEGDLKGITKKWDFGFNFGAGIDVRLWKGILTLKGIYSYSFINLNKGGEFKFMLDDLVADVGNTEKEDVFKNRGFQILIGYTLPLGKK